MEPIASDAANLRFRCLARALSPAARAGSAGISQRFRTIQIMSSQQAVTGVDGDLGFSFFRETGVCLQGMLRWFSSWMSYPLMEFTSSIFAVLVCR